MREKIYKRREIEGGGIEEGVGSSGGEKGTVEKRGGGTIHKSSLRKTGDHNISRYSLPSPEVSQSFVRLCLDTDTTRINGNNV